MGQTRTIRWESQEISGDLEITLVRDGEAVRQIAGQVPADSGEYEWTIPTDLIESFNYRVEITSLDDGEFSDRSDQPFTINSPPSSSIRILDPHAGTLWYRGQSYAINWQSQDVAGNLKIQLLRNDTLVNTIVPETNNDGKYIWQIPDTLRESSGYQITLSTLNGSATSASSGFFTITPWEGNINVTVPNSATIWSLGEENVLIGWQTGNLEGDVGIYLFRGEDSLLTITDSTGNDGGYSGWTVPDTLALDTTYNVKVSLSDSLYDFSAEFEIQAQIGNIEVTQPTDTTVWMQSQPDVPIRWNTGNLQGPVMISLYRDDQRIATIGDSVPNTGVYDKWDVPSPLPPGNNYRVRVLYDDEHFDFSPLFQVREWTGPMKVTAPRDTTIWTQGDKDVPIRWETGGLEGMVQIRLIAVNGAEFTIVDSTANDGAYVGWDVPYDIPGGEGYRVLISLDETNFTYSDSFRIQPALLAPVEHNITRVAQGALSLGDYDGDDDQDLLLSGLNQAGDPTTILYETTDFPELEPTSMQFEDIILRDAEWVDYDQDGDLDLSVCGKIDSLKSDVQDDKPIVRLYNNQGGGNFIEDDTSLPQLAKSALSWADFNNDSLPDLLLTGTDSSVVYKNAGNGDLVPLNRSFQGLEAALAEWEDFDGDGDPDIVLGGLSGSPVFIFYENKGDEQFSSFEPDITALWDMVATTGDYNLDGDIDIIVSGNSLTGGTKLVVYQNQGDWSFSEQSTDLDPITSGALVLRDIENDGDPDLIVSGRLANGLPSTKIYENTGAGEFVPIDLNLTNHIHSTFTLGDIDSDGDLDLLSSGLNIGGDPVVSFYRNNSATEPPPPPPPPSDAEGNEGVPQTFVLEQNYPNPFNPVTHIRFYVPRSTDVRVSIYDLRGQRVSVLRSGKTEVGWHQVDWRPGSEKNLSSGMYILRLEAGSKRLSRKMLYLK